MTLPWAKAPKEATCEEGMKTIGRRRTWAMVVWKGVRENKSCFFRIYGIFPSKRREMKL